MTNKYQVVVGNIGTVYDGSDETVARQTFLEYVGQSELEYGRASLESVVLLEDNEIIDEHLGRND